MMTLNEHKRTVKLINACKRGGDDTTPHDLVDIMINQLPTELFINPNSKFLDPCVGSGTFLLTLYYKLIEYHTHDHIVNNMLYGIDNKLWSFRFLTSKVGLKNIYKQDFLTFETNMNFDVTIGNSPYQNVHGAKRWPLWHEFIHKMKTISNLVAVVSPASIVAPSDIFRENRDKITYLNLDASRHFNVGSTFAWYIIDQNKTDQTPAKIVKNNIEYEIDLSRLEFLPIELNSDTIAMLEEMQTVPAMKWKRGEFHTSNSTWKTDNGIEVLHTSGKVLHTQTTHNNLQKIRVAVSLSGYPKFHVVEGKGLTQAVVWTEFDNLETANQVAEYYNSDYIQEILKTFKWSGWNSKSVIERLPVPDNIL
jgi:hypothetical protein